MDEATRYRPEADFLNLILDDQIEFGPDVFGRANLARLVAMTRDALPANRDWAVMLLAQTGEDSPAIRAAFVARLDDPHEDTALEAVCGLAARDRVAALPVVRAWLERDSIAFLALEAAALVADPALSAVLDAIAEGWRDEPADEWLPSRLAFARRCCADGVAYETADDG